MAAIVVDFARPAFHGLRDDGTVDWPPSPLRLAGALTSGAYAVGDAEVRGRALNAVQRLVRCPNPVILAPDAVALGLPPTYTERTAVTSKLGSQSGAKLSEFLDLSRIGMDTSSRVPKPVDGVALAGTRVAFLVDGWTPADEDRAALDTAMGHIGYFGRSHNTAALYLADEVDAAAYARRWHPTSLPGRATRGWQSNSPRWFDLNFDTTYRHPDRPLVSARGYYQPLRYSTHLPAADAARRVEIVTLDQPVAQQKVPALMEALAAKAPGADLFPCVTTVAHQAGSRCLGVGVVADPAHPGSASHAEVVAERVRALQPNPARRIVRRDPLTLRPETWQRPARQWVSATPLRGFPDIRVLAHTLREQARDRYGSDVTIHRAEPQPFATWHTRWPARNLTDGLAQWWLDIEFPAPVVGPLRLGATTSHGYGLFVPRGNEGKPHDNH